MTVTKIEPVTKTRYKVYVDGQFAFVLYKGELSRYHIAEDSELEEEIYQNLRKEIVLKRAKLRAMHLLNDMGRTESQLRTKLLRNDYPPDIVEEAIAYVKDYIKRGVDEINAYGVVSETNIIDDYDFENDDIGEESYHPADIVYSLAKINSEIKENFVLK